MNPNEHLGESGKDRRRSVIVLQDRTGPALDVLLPYRVIGIERVGRLSVRPIGIPGTDLSKQHPKETIEILFFTAVWAKTVQGKDGALNET